MNKNIYRKGEYKKYHYLSAEVNSVTQMIVNRKAARPLVDITTIMRVKMERTSGCTDTW